MITADYRRPGESLTGTEVLAADGEPILSAVKSICNKSGCRREEEDCIRSGELFITYPYFITSGVQRSATRTLRLRNSTATF